MQSGWPMMRLAHTTMLPHLAPPYRSAILLNTDSGIWNEQLPVARVEFPSLREDSMDLAHVRKMHYNARG